MRTPLILAASVAALAVGTIASAQQRLPENLSLPSSAPDNSDQLRVPAANPEPYRNGAYNDLIIRQMDGGRCWLRYVAYDSDNGQYRYGEAVPTPCSLTIAQAVSTDANPAGSVATLEQMRATVGEGPAARGQPLGARTAVGSQVSARVPDYGYMPLSYSGGWDAWRAHQEACDDRYRTFDRSTDMFVAVPGRKEFCNIGLKPAN